MFLKKILCLEDNYIYILYNIYNKCIIIDPGVSSPVIKFINKNKLQPIAILLTHKHIDHIQGTYQLKNAFPNINIFGSSEIKNLFNIIPVNLNQKLNIDSFTFRVIFTPGHTKSHICYFINPYLFCGDVIFYGGCGNFLKKNTISMYHSITKLLTLPDQTILCPGHEYSYQNLFFAHKMFPFEKIIKKKWYKLKNNIQNYSLNTLEEEKKINIFLRSNSITLQKSVKKNFCYAWEFLWFLREEKNKFNIKNLWS
ncbi:Hydroxyacylglutathione hydrolase GloB [Buchnera aphidicola (Thelaxes suberi)]|uniref:hydroxyacylglutathione hydrolase n=1 Tax=Buchnera aphidicola TaxID=9 RepID=UPI003464E2BF